MSNKVVGIDLGTTYSLVADGSGIVVGLTDSAVDLEQGLSSSRHSAKESVVSSYKTDMGLGTSGEIPVKCSAITLQNLNKKYEAVTGEKFKSVVISVPAYFSASQREAVYKAAEIAGLEVKTLINEPTAGALHVCKDLKDLIVVYDLGGGTFDVSIIDARAGSYAVIATSGMVIGGDNLDLALSELAFKEMKVKMLNRSADKKKYMRSLMVKAKEKIQKTRRSVMVPMTAFGVDGYFELKPEVYKEVVREVFGDTIKKTKYIVNANIPDVEVPKMVYIGGSTACPFLRELLHEAIDFKEVETDLNPNTTVALGVGRYAEMVEEGVAFEEVEDITKQLGIETENGTILSIIEEGSQVPCSNTVVVSNAFKTDTLSIKLYQGNNLLAKANDYLGLLNYSYGRVVEQNEGVVEITVHISHGGIITLSASEPLFDEEPQEIKLVRR